MELDEGNQDEYYDDVAESFIQEAKYEKVSPREVAEQQKHLTTHQQKLLEERLSKFNRLFDGTLGHYKDTLIHLEIDEDAVPVHSKAYSVPKAHEEIFKKELRHLIEIGVLRPCGPTEWACPTFIIPKKPEPDGTQRV